MSVLASYKSIIEKIKVINLPLLINIKVKEQEKKKSDVAENMGRHKNYLYKQLKNTDQPVSLLILLSIHLQTNFLEPFQNLLPENIRTTTQEKNLQQQIVTLQKQLEDVQKERDLLKEIVMK